MISSGNWGSNSGKKKKKSKLDFGRKISAKKPHGNFHHSGWFLNAIVKIKKKKKKVKFSVLDLHSDSEVTSWCIKGASSHVFCNSHCSRPGLSRAPENSTVAEEGGVAKRKRKVWPQEVLWAQLWPIVRAVWRDTGCGENQPPHPAGRCQHFQTDFQSKLNP